jgi:hypothetical protein
LFHDALRARFFLGADGGGSSVTCRTAIAAFNFSSLPSGMEIEAPWACSKRSMALFKAVAKSFADLGVVRASDQT